MQHAKLFAYVNNIQITGFLFDLLELWDVRALSIRKTADLPLQLRVGTFPRFVAIGFFFPPKPLYKSLHQSFFYSFITTSESGVTLDYCMIFPYTLSFRHFTFTFKHLSRDFEKTTITAMYHGR
jgi:hypothetical protein